MNIKKEFGLRIKEVRNKKGITQYQLAELVGIDPKHIEELLKFAGLLLPPT